MPRGVFVLYFVLWGVKYGSFFAVQRVLWPFPCANTGAALLLL